MVDKKDLAIMRLLDADVRASASQIGKATRLSQDVVQYRIKKLEERGVITGYWSVLNLGHDYVVYKVLIKNRSLSKEKRQELVTYLLSQPFVSWFADTEGNYDYVMTIITNDEKGFAYLLEEFFTLFGSYFQEKHILKSTRAVMTNEKYLYDNGINTHQHALDFLSDAPESDDTDQLILTELSRNSRVSYASLAEKTKLTAEAVSYRIRRLLKEKRIIGYRVRIDFSKLGYSYYHVFLSLQDQSKRESIASYYLAHPRCVFVMHHLGRYDLHLEFIVPSAEIQDVMDELRDKFGNYLAGYELLLIRKEHTLHLIK